MPLQATSGAASYDAFGGGVPVEPNYIESVFSTFLYTGTGATQTITNGIDLAGEGGLVWGKRRNAANSHWLIDTVRGAGNRLESDGTGAQTDASAQFPSFNSNGFTVATADNEFNNSAGTYVSWSFAKAPKFFDVVTYTGNGTAGRTVAHNLGAVPGCIIVKDLAATNNWRVYHRSLGATKVLVLNLTSAEATSSLYWNDTAPTSTEFTLGTHSGVNANGGTYVAYLFAHDAGGFGLSGTDNVISCGSYTGNGSATGPVIDLGYEPQFLIVKRTDSAGRPWTMWDVMRGLANNGTRDDRRLRPNTSEAEGNSPYGHPTATGFTVTGINADYNGSGGTYIYIAIRRGPMKVPTDGTKVFSPIKAFNATGTKNTTNFPVDLQITKNFVDGGSNNVNDRLRGVSSVSTEASESGPFLDTNSTAAEVLAYRTLDWDNTGFKTPGNYSNYDFIYWNFSRAPGFFDEVCYTGNSSSTRVVNHNLGVTPELIIVKCRSSDKRWPVFQSSLGITGSEYNSLYLDNTDAVVSGAGLFRVAGLNATTFGLTQYGIVNDTGETYVAYLFATCPGVSKVFSFTGNGTTQTINCGFTGGARFVLLKASSATCGWYVYDTARGMTVLTDPYLQLNTTAAEVATLGSVTTVSTGFAVNEAITTGVNTNGVTYIGLAIA
jgi:hypothetical protein